MNADHLVPCVGGPTTWRRVSDPPPLEIDLDDGVYVLDDVDGTEHYVFVPS